MTRRTKRNLLRTWYAVIDWTPLALFLFVPIFSLIAIIWVAFYIVDRSGCGFF